MYRLMKSKKHTLDQKLAGHMPLYRQSEVIHFQQVGEALEACELANIEGRFRHYILNELGQEYYDGTWID